MAFLGMRGTGNWLAGAIPENWRESILYMYPNGDAPLMAILSMLGAESTDSPNFNWWSKSLPSQDADVTGIFLNPQLTTAYVSGGVAGDVVYVKMAAANVSEFRNGHQVTLSKKIDPRFDCTAKIVGRVEAGASSYIAAKLIETPAVGREITSANINYVAVIGNVNAEGATMPDAIAYDPTASSNNTQIFRTPLSITRTARKTRLKYGSDAYLEAKREALELHAIEMNNAFIFGEKSETIGHNNKPERTTRGLLTAIRKEMPGNFRDYRTDPAFAGQTWLQGGQAWLNTAFEELSDYGSDERLALHGGGAGAGITALVDAGSDVTITPQTKDYGIRVKEWVTTNLTVNLKKDPTFSRRPTTESLMLLLEPKHLRFRYIDDTDFISDPQDKINRNNSKDATEEEFLTEAGLEYHHLQTAMALYGVGQNNVV